MRIRLATLDDLAGILAISNWAAVHTHANFSSGEESLESWQREFEQTHEKHAWLVAVDDGKVVAFAKSSPFRGRCAYSWSAEVTVYVDPAHHGRGLARSLYALLIPMLEAQGYATLIAQIALPNDASVRLHESFGFKEIGRLERIGWKFERWHDVVMLEKVLIAESTTPKAIHPVREVLPASLANPEAATTRASTTSTRP